MTKDKSRIQSCIDHINTAIDVDPWAKELVAEMGKEMLKAQLSCEGTTSDCISRQAVRFIESNSDSYPEEWNDDYEKGFTDALNKVIALPSVQPDVPDTNVGDMISRQAAIGICKARLYECAMNNIGYECKADEVFRDIAEHRIGIWLEELPSVQPEIIRCKDCEYGKQDEVGRWFCQIGNEDGSGFCADAERRTDE